MVIKMLDIIIKKNIKLFIFLIFICILLIMVQSISSESSKNNYKGVDDYRKEIQLSGKCYDFFETHEVGDLNHIGPFWFWSPTSILTFRFDEDFELIVDGIVQDVEPPMNIFILRFSGFCPMPIQYRNIDGSKEISLRGFCEAYICSPIVEEDTIDESPLFTVSDFLDFDQLALGVTHADFNEDGLMDFAVIAAEKSMTNISIFYNENNMNFAHDIAYSFNNLEWGSFKDLDSGDFDNDGDVDLMFTHSESVSGWKTNGTIYLIYNDGNGTFGNLTLITRHCSDIDDMYGRFNPVVCPADYDKDGDVDFVVGDNSGKIELYLNNGNADFSSVGILHDYGQLSWGITSGDFDNDGDVDLIVSAENEKQYGLICLKRNLLVESDGSTCFENGSGEILYHTFSGRGSFYLDSIDYNRDGFLDFIGGTKSVIIFINDGDASFNDFTVGNLPGQHGYVDHLYYGGMTSFDIDMDRREDLITGGVQGMIRFCLNNFSQIPPLKPSILGEYGYWDGEIDHEFEYIISTKDINNDDVFYYVDWDDGSNSGWIGPYPSGEEVIVKHTWNEPGVYYVSVKAKDTNNQVSRAEEFQLVILRENRPYSRNNCEQSMISYDPIYFGLNCLLFRSEKMLKSDIFKS